LDFEISWEYRVLLWGREIQGKLVIFYFNKNLQENKLVGAYEAFTRCYMILYKWNTRSSLKKIITPRVVRCSTAQYGGDVVTLALS